MTSGFLLLMSNSYILDKFVSVKAGDPYRLFAFGEIKRGGVTRIITPEYAAQFKLPPFKPPVKLGSHDDATPAGGHITRLEVREDGLYAYPEFTDKGSRAVVDGDYRYHSPEVIWDDGALETNDGVIAGPLILGDALLHSPYLGESTAFYSASVAQENIMQENVSIPKSLFEQLLAWLKPSEPEQAPEPQPEPVKVEETAEFKAKVQERDDYKAQLETLKADNARKESVATLSAQLQKKDDYGAVFAEAPAADEAAGILADMKPETQEWVMRNFRALIAQINESNLTKEVGSEQATTADEDPKARYNALVLKLAEERKISYTAAFEEGKAVYADVFQAAFKK